MLNHVCFLYFPICNVIVASIRLYIIKNKYVTPCMFLENINNVYLMSRIYIKYITFYIDIFTNSVESQLKHIKWYYFFLKKLMLSHDQPKRLKSFLLIWINTFWPITRNYVICLSFMICSTLEISKYCLYSPFFSFTI